ncbi:MAG: glycine cleavage system protein GcvH [Thermanaerothrix sp.]|nr:glycine cleavage system protein GcvH [Thermanaerothrix sp.]
MNIPSDLKYTTTDEWVKVEGNTAIVGVTDYAQSQLSDIVFFEFHVEIGEEVKKGGVIATLESVKAAADVNAPISGKVVARNEALTEKFELVNSDPYGEAWMLKIEMSNPQELDNLMDASAYQKYCQEREH